MRIAVLADIHGNLPALRAVLSEIDRDPVDVIVIAGDVVGGPLVRESLQSLAARPEPVRWISGNGEREAVAAYDGAPVADDPAGRAAAWSASALDSRWRDELASWAISLQLDGAMFCHGSPRRDDEILTSQTPQDDLQEALTGVAEPLAVGGHTHRQLVRPVRDGLSYVNAGSVGLPYEGRAGAFWLLVDHGEPAMRETAYELGPALDELRASGFVGLEDHLDGALLAPADPDWVAAFLEHLAGRGEHPGEQRPATAAGQP